MEIPEIGSLWKHRSYPDTYVRIKGSITSFWVDRIIMIDALDSSHSWGKALPAFLVDYIPVSRLEILVLSGEHISES